MISMNIENFKKAIAIAGSQVNLAKKMGNTNVSTLAQWVSRKQVPPEQVVNVCTAIDFAVTPHEIRPDIYPHPTDGLPNELRCDCKKVE